MSDIVQKDRRDQRRDAILEVASAVFAEEGYAAASMSTIAARLGGSKGTLYNYFKSKEELFAAYVREQCGRFADAVFTGGELREPAVWLTLFGERFLSHLMSDWAVRTFQLVVAEARRTPELARVFYDAGPAVGVQRLAAMLEAARDRGDLVADDCELAAHQFISLCRGNLHFRYCLNLMARPSDAEIAAAVREAVATFLARFGRKAPGGGGEAG